MIHIFRWSAADHNCRWQKGELAPEQLAELRTTTDTVWIDLVSPTEHEIDQIFRNCQAVHNLTLEDITRQRRDPDGHPHFPKVEEFPDYLFVIVNPLTATTWPEGDDSATIVTQLSALLTTTRLITFHEQPVPAVDQLREYLGKHAELANRGPDYMFHLVLDAMVDEYAPLLDSLVDRVDALEEAVFDHRSSELLNSLLHLKRRLTHVRKTLAYEREVLARMSRGEFALIDERETVYYRNVYDHLVRFTELTEGSREMVADLLQTHLSVVSNRLNEVMKALTMVSTIVLPMSVVAGVYGMNFDHIPEIHKPWGYPMALGLMALCGLLPLAWFKWKGWV